MSGMKLSLRTGIPLILGLLVLIILLYSSLVLQLPFVETLLERNLTDKVQAITELAKPAIAKALETGDDISLLIQVESLSRTADVAAAYVLDENGTVVIHNKTAEWRKAYTDPASLKAVHSPSSLVQRVPGGYLYSVPAASSATLCVQLSSQRSDALRRYAVRRALLTGVILFLVSLVFIVFIVSVTVVSPLKRLTDFTRNYVPGAAWLMADRSLEITTLAGTVNELLDRFEQERSDAKYHYDEAKKNTSMLLEAATSKSKDAIIITDNDNVILAMNEAARKRWGIDGAVGKHILDVKELTGLVALVQSASTSANCGREIFAVIDGKTVGVHAMITPEQKVAGKIVRVVDL
jgi:PAS domain-containing protein